jgi:hypothetical protein
VICISWMFTQIILSFVWLYFCVYVAVFVWNCVFRHSYQICLLFCFLFFLNWTAEDYSDVTNHTNAWFMYNFLVKDGRRNYAIRFGANDCRHLSCCCQYFLSTFVILNKACQTQLQKTHTHTHNQASKFCIQHRRYNIWHCLLVLNVSSNFDWSQRKTTNKIACTISLEMDTPIWRYSSSKLTTLGCAPLHYYNQAQIHNTKHCYNTVQVFIIMKRQEFTTCIRSSYYNIYMQLKKSFYFSKHK